MINRMSNHSSPTIWPKNTLHYPFNHKLDDVNDDVINHISRVWRVNTPGGDARTDKVENSRELTYKTTADLCCVFWSETIAFSHFRISGLSVREEKKIEEVEVNSNGSRAGGLSISIVVQLNWVQATCFFPSVSNY